MDSYGSSFAITRQWASLLAQRVMPLSAMWETRVRSLSWEDPLQKEMATHSSTLAWKIPWMEEPGGEQSTGLQRVGHNGATSLTSLIEATGLPRWLRGKEFACQCRRPKRLGFDPWVWKIPWSGEWQPAPVFLPGKSHGPWSLVGHSPWGRKRVRDDLATKRRNSRGNSLSR